MSSPEASVVEEELSVSPEVAATISLEGLVGEVESPSTTYRLHELHVALDLVSKEAQCARSEASNSAAIAREVHAVVRGQATQLQGLQEELRRDALELEEWREKCSEETSQLQQAMQELQDYVAEGRQHPAPRDSSSPYECQSISKLEAQVRALQDSVDQAASEKELQDWAKGVAAVASKAQGVPPRRKPLERFDIITDKLNWLENEVQLLKTAQKEVEWNATRAKEKAEKDPSSKSATLGNLEELRSEMARKTELEAFQVRCEGIMNNTSRYTTTGLEEIRQQTVRLCDFQAFQGHCEASFSSVRADAERALAALRVESEKRSAEGSERAETLARQQQHLHCSLDSLQQLRQKEVQQQAALREEVWQHVASLGKQQEQSKLDLELVSKKMMDESFRVFCTTQDAEHFSAALTEASARTDELEALAASLAQRQESVRHDVESMQQSLRDTLQRHLEASCQRLFKEAWQKVMAARDAPRADRSVGELREALQQTEQKATAALAEAQRAAAFAELTTQQAAQRIWKAAFQDEGGAVRRVLEQMRDIILEELQSALGQVSAVTPREGSGVSGSAAGAARMLRILTPDIKRPP